MDNTGGEGSFLDAKDPKDEGGKQPDSANKENEGSFLDKDQGDKDSAPEIDYSLELPEGDFLTNEDRDSVLAFAKENKLSNEAAQAVLNDRAAAVKSWQDRSLKTFRENREQWKQDFKNDKDYGLELFEESKKHAQAALDAFGSKELIDGLKESGYDEWNPIKKFLVNVGRKFKSDSVGNGDPVDNANVPLKVQWYSKTTPGPNR